MCRVFVSHSSDAKEFAENLTHRFEAAGISCFLDKKALPAGQAYDERLAQAVRRSAVFLFVISGRTAELSTYARTELNIAVEAKRRILGVRVPGFPDVKPPPAVLSTTMVPPDGEPIAEALQRVQKLLPWYCRTQKWVLPAVTVAALALLTALGFIYLGTKADSEFLAGKELLRKEKPFEALPHLETAFSLRRWGFARCSSELLVALAYALEDTGDRELAERRYRAVEACEDSPVVALNNRAMSVYLDGGANLTAQDLLLRARKYLERPENGAPADDLAEDLGERRRLFLHKNLAAVALALEHYGDAERELLAADRILALRPDLREDYTVLACLRGHTRLLRARTSTTAEKRAAHLAEAREYFDLSCVRETGGGPLNAPERKMKNDALDALRSFDATPR